MCGENPLAINVAAVGNRNDQELFCGIACLINDPGEPASLTHPIAQILNEGDDLLGTGFGETPEALIASDI